MLRAATASSTSWRKISLTSNGTTWTDMAKRGARVADAEGGGRRTGEATRRREGLAGDVFCKDEARDGRRRWASNRSERVRALRGREAEARAAARVSMVALAQHAEAQPVNCLGRPCSRGGHRRRYGEVVIEEEAPVLKTLAACERHLCCPASRLACDDGCRPSASELVPHARSSMEAVERPAGSAKVRGRAAK